MARTITEHELLNDAPAITQAVEGGESIVVTRDGTPIVDLIPHTRGTEPRGARGSDLIAAINALPPIDVDKFWADLESVVDYDPFRGPGEPERTE